MSTNAITSKVALPYARAFFDFSIQKNIMHQITADFQNLMTFLDKVPELTSHLSNPIVNQEAKKEILTKTIRSQINEETFKFILLLIKRDRIKIIKDVISAYLEFVYETASIKMIEVATPYDFNNSQKTMLIDKLKELTNAREIRLVVSIDSSLIGGFLIKSESKVLDFSIKNQLQQLAKHLDTVLEI